MLRKFWNAIRGRRTESVILIPFSSRLPDLWPRDISGHPKANLSVLPEASTDVLMELCDHYWDSFFSDDEDDDVITIYDHEICRRARDILSTRGPEVIGWARERLRHSGYDARHDAAWLLGEFAARRQLGSEKKAVASELAALAIRPFEEDTKELQANSAALDALRHIGDETCLATMRRILLSPEWDDDDIQHDAACALADLTGQPFLESDNPVQAAKDWIRANP